MALNGDDPVAPEPDSESGATPEATAAPQGSGDDGSAGDAAAVASEAAAVAVAAAAVAEEAAGAPLAGEGAAGEAPTGDISAAKAALAASEAAAAAAVAATAAEEAAAAPPTAESAAAAGAAAMAAMAAAAAAEKAAAAAERAAAAAGGGSPDSPEGSPEDVVEAGPKRGRTGIWRGPLLPLGGIIVVGIVVAAIVVGTDSPKKNPKTKSSSTTTTTTKPVPTTTVQVPAGGFSISYPDTWERYADPNAQLLVVDGKTQNAFEVQENQISKPVTSATSVAQVKKLTDTLIQASSAKIEAEQSVNINGMPGYYYLVLYKQNNQVGANTIEFLFQGRKMARFTFQAFPYTNFTVGLGATFDQIVKSYKSNPNILGPVLPAATKTTTSTTTKTTGTTAKAKSTTAKT